MESAQLWLVSFLTEFQKLPLLTQYAIIFLSVTGLIVHVAAYNDKTAHDGPTLFTTAGIFFTFVGILLTTKSMKGFCWRSDDRRVITYELASIH